MNSTIVKSAISLAIFAGASFALVVAVAKLTAAPIKDQQEKQLVQQIQAVTEGLVYDNRLQEDCYWFDSKGELGKTPSRLFKLIYQQQLVGWVFNTTATNGYSGDIELLIGTDSNFQLRGVRVIRHQETPGLGDKIELQKSDWIKQFTGLSLQNPKQERWALTQDGGAFDSFTGATITPRAVVMRIKAALDYLIKNNQSLDRSMPKCTEPLES